MLSPARQGHVQAASGPELGPPPRQAAGGATGQQASGHGPACLPSAAGADQRPGCRAAPCPRAQPETVGPGPSQHQIHVLGGDRRKCMGEEKDRGWFGPRGGPAHPFLQAAYLDLAEGHEEGEGLVEVGKAVPFRLDVFLFLHFLWFSMSWTCTWGSGQVKGIRGVPGLRAEHRAMQRGRYGSHLPGPGSGFAPAARPRSAGPSRGRTAARNTALPPARPAGSERALSLPCDTQSRARLEPGSPRPHLHGARRAQLVPLFQDMLQVDGAQRQVELGQWLVGRESFEAQHAHLQGGPRQRSLRHLRARV